MKISEVEVGKIRGNQVSGGRGGEERVGKMEKIRDGSVKLFKGGEEGKVMVNEAKLRYEIRGNEEGGRESVETRRR